MASGFKVKEGGKSKYLLSHVSLGRVYLDGAGKEGGICKPLQGKKGKDIHREV